jgi:mono/diheme cytochrome c family protein
MKQLILILLPFLMLINLARAEESKHDKHQHEKINEHAKHWMAPEKEANKKNPVKNTPESILRGRQLFVKTCANCHGMDATGDGPAATSLATKPANLRTMSGRHPDGDFAWKIANGRGEMPAWKSILGKNQIWDIVNYIQSLSTKIEEKKEQKKDTHQHVINNVQDNSLQQAEGSK